MLILDAHPGQRCREGQFDVVEFLASASPSPAITHLVLLVEQTLPHGTPRVPREVLKALAARADICFAIPPDLVLGRVKVLSVSLILAPPPHTTKYAQRASPAHSRHGWSGRAVHEPSMTWRSVSSGRRRKTEPWSGTLVSMSAQPAHTRSLTRRTTVPA